MNKRQTKQIHSDSPFGLFELRSSRSYVSTIQTTIRPADDLMKCYILKQDVGEF